MKNGKCISCVHYDCRNGYCTVNGRDVNGNWQKVAKVWKKVSGSWLLQPDKSSLFSQNVTYINGGNL